MKLFHKIAALALACPLAASSQTAAWPQWALNPQHTGNVAVAGQPVQAKLSNIVFDPFVAQEIAETGELEMHYQVPLVNGSTVFMNFKSGSYVPCSPPGSKTPFPCGPDAWNSEIWNETALQWQNGQLVTIWNFASDWKPVPNSGTTPSTRGLAGWEPLFQPALVGPYIYVPGAGGTVYQVNQADGSLVAQINPFGTAEDPTIFVFGPLTADNAGNIYYNAIQVDLSWPWDVEPANSWVVKIAPDSSTIKTSFSTYLPSVSLNCLGTFAGRPYPWPPTPTSVVRSVFCGVQRPAMNIAPVLSGDGATLYTLSRAHFSGRDSYLIAVNTADLSLQWATSLQGLLNDGCNVLLPANGQPGGCSNGATTGVDPTQNLPGAGMMLDQSSGSPVVTPDGSILMGVYTDYNYARGHLLKFSPQGSFQAAYDFGWDSTPAIYPHNGTYSVVLKDNHYPVGSYCGDPTWCPKAPIGPYYITQLDANLAPEWKYKVVSNNPRNGFCVNAPAVDANGVVYSDNENGNLYAIQQGGTVVHSIAIGGKVSAGYTPVSIGGDGLIYSMNAGRLVAVGAPFSTATQITSSSPNPSVYGQAVQFNVQVSSSGTMPAGTVTLKRGAIKLGTLTLSGGMGSFNTSATQLPGGNDQITASYSGDATHAASISSAFVQVVSQAPTSTALSSSLNPSPAGGQVTFTATVTSSPGIPGGTVQFKSNGAPLGTVSLVNGVATLTTTFSGAGSYTVTAAYSSSPNFAKSSTSLTQVVQ